MNVFLYEKFVITRHTHPQVVPDLYEVLSSVKQKIYILKNVLTDSWLGAIDF